MGADMCLQAILMKPKGYRGNYSKLEWGKAQIILKKACNAMKMQIIRNEKKIPVHGIWEGFFDTMYGGDLSHVINMTMAQRKQAIVDVVDSIADMTTRRDVSFWCFPERLCWFSGGMSWGDSPTDIYDKMYAFMSLPEKYLTRYGFDAIKG